MTACEVFSVENAAEDDMNRFRRILKDVLAGTLGQTGTEGTRWIVLPSVIGVVLLAAVLFRQTALGLPVPTRPLPGEVAHGRNVMFAWNAVPGAAVQVQMGSDRSFSSIMYSTNTNDKVTYSRAYRIFTEPGEYYWRMRHVRKGRPGSWTRPIKFLVE